MAGRVHMQSHGCAAAEGSTVDGVDSVNMLAVLECRARTGDCSVVHHARIRKMTPRKTSSKLRLNGHENSTQQLNGHEHNARQLLVLVLVQQ